MPDSMMYQEDIFVILETDQTEQFLTPDELSEKLVCVLQSDVVEIPKDVQQQPSLFEQAQYLRDHYCELDLGENQYLQWYVTRIEK